MTTYFIGIGFAVGTEGKTLTSRERLDFVDQVAEAIGYFGGSIFFHGFGRGEYTRDDGVTITEDSHSTGFTADIPEVGYNGLDALRNRLARLARTYGQETIALVTGETDFIEP